MVIAVTLYPMWIPRVRNSEMLTSKGNRGRPMAPEGARSARSRINPAFNSALTWRLTVEMLSPVRSAASSRNSGPDNRAARRTSAAGLVDNSRRGVATCTRWSPFTGPRRSATGPGVRVGGTEVNGTGWRVP